MTWRQEGNAPGRQDGDAHLPWFPSLRSRVSNSTPPIERSATAGGTSEEVSP
jgi:hypothetical protein